MYAQLQRRYQESFRDTILSEAADKMVEHVEEAALVQLVHKKMDSLSTQAWRTLQMAFAQELKGSYTKLSLFKCFFGKFALPGNSELEKSLDELRCFAAERVRQFIIDDMVSVLGTGGTRASQAAGVSEAVKASVKKAVEDAVPVSDTSQVLDEALGVLKRGLKGGHKSLKALLYESQVESLQEHLLSRDSTEDKTVKDRRKREGQWLHNHFKRRVSENASAVIEGAKQRFVGKVEASVDKMLKELKSRFISRRGKAQRLPVLFKLRRACFKSFNNFCGAAGAEFEMKAADADWPLLLAEFSSKWRALLAHDADPDAHKRLSSVIFARHLIINLEGAADIPAKCRAKLGKVTKHDPAPVSFEEAMAFLKKIKEGTAGADLTSYLALRERTKRWKLGFCPKDKSSLFRALDQLLHNKCLQEPGGDLLLGEAPAPPASGEAAAHDRESTDKLREAIVRIVLLKHTTTEECERFSRQYGVVVQDWATRMLSLEEPGDEVCLEYFARHFRVCIWLYSPVCDHPLQFPMYLGQVGDQMSSTVGDSVYRIAHMPFEPPDIVNLHHYLPLWPMALVSIAQTPLGTPLAHEEEYVIEEGRQMKSLSEMLRPERDRRRDTAAVRTQKADLFGSAHKLWKKGFSKKHNREYWCHVKSGVNCWPEDVEAVRNNTHEKLKIPLEFER